MQNKVPCSTNLYRKKTFQPFLAFIKRMKTPDYIKFEEMLEETKNESDRGCALILAANLDNRLRELLCSFFINVSFSYEKELFEGNGCLASFSSRIQLSYVLGLLAKNEHNDLNIIRKIRNDFAHKEHGWSFQTQEIRDRCKSLAMIAQLRKEYSSLPIDLTNPRFAFQIAASSLSLLLLERAKICKTDKRSTPANSTILPSKKTHISNETDGILKEADKA